MPKEPCQRMFDPKGSDKDEDWAGQDLMSGWIVYVVKDCIAAVDIGNISDLGCLSDLEA